MNPPTRLQLLLVSTRAGPGAGSGQVRLHYHVCGLVPGAGQPGPSQTLAFNGTLGSKDRVCGLCWARLLHPLVHMRAKDGHSLGRSTSCQEPRLQVGHARLGQSTTHTLKIQPGSKLGKGAKGLP